MKNQAKKTIALLLLAAILTGCGGGTTVDTTADTTADTDAQTTADTTPAETEAADREMRRERRTIRARCSEEYIPAIRSWQAARQAARMRQAHLFRG